MQRLILYLLLVYFFVFQLISFSGSHSLQPNWKVMSKLYSFLCLGCQFYFGDRFSAANVWKMMYSRVEVAVGNILRIFQGQIFFRSAYAVPILEMDDNRNEYISTDYICLSYQNALLQYIAYNFFPVHSLKHIRANYLPSLRCRLSDKVNHLNSSFIRYLYLSNIKNVFKKLKKKKSPFFLT